MASAALPAAPSRSARVAAPLTGMKLLIAAIAVGIGNFLVVLDTTIANVSVPNIAGSLGVSASQGTWVITSYAVAEAITVPLTGWLTRRFGAQKVFITCYLAFGVLSILCGLAMSLGMLITGRVLLGLAGGPLMPLSQMLLLRIFPKDKAVAANIIWAMTTLIAPVAGPILGGLISDSIGWQWIFFIKVPVAFAGGLTAWTLLRGQPDPKENASVDVVGLILLIIWVGSFQIMLDEGRNHDWFASGEIVTLGVVALVGFIAFLMWELTAKNPIVNLRIFRHRGFTASAITYSAGFGAFFASIVIFPLWLQQNLGYTATWAGYATGIMGILSIAVAPAVGKAVEKIDARLIISIGLAGLGLVHVWRTFFTPDATFWQIAGPTFLSGAFMVMFFVPVTGLAMASVDPEEAADAAGVSNFMRTLAGAFATALVQTGWANSAREKQTELAGAMTDGQATVDGMVASGMQPDAAVASLSYLVEGQSLMLATLAMFGTVVLVFFAAAAVIWLAPKPNGPIDTTAGH
jgi:DHA2 family multidrug resistance protein